MKSPLQILHLEDDPNDAALVQSTLAAGGCRKPERQRHCRMKLMSRLSVHDAPGLVRFALRVGLIPQET